MRPLIVTKPTAYWCKACQEWHLGSEGVWGRGKTIGVAHLEWLRAIYLKQIEEGNGRIEKVKGVFMPSHRIH